MQLEAHSHSSVCCSVCVYVCVSLCVCLAWCRLAASGWKTKLLPCDKWKLDDYYRNEGDADDDDDDDGACQEDSDDGNGDCDVNINVSINDAWRALCNKQNEAKANLRLLHLLQPAKKTTNVVVVVYVSVAAVVAAFTALLCCCCCCWPLVVLAKNCSAHSKLPQKAATTARGAKRGQQTRI